MSDLFAFLARHDIAYERCDHPAVYTVEESLRLVPPLPGAKTKNLFLRDRKGRRHLLVVVPHDLAVDLKGLGAVLDTGPLGFGSSERLAQFLDIEPGSVSLLALFNDGDRRVELVVDARVWAAAAIQAHPLVNTVTLVLPRASVERFVEATGHRPRVVEVPARPSGEPAGAQGPSP